MKHRKSKTPTAESIHAIDYSRRLELFETACKVFAIPIEVRHVRPKHRTSIARIRLATPAQFRVVEKLLEPGDMTRVLS